MANYNSAYTGPQIDDAVGKMRGITSDSAAIDRAVEKVEQITSTPSEIDGAVSYMNPIRAEVTSSQVIDAAKYVDSLDESAETVNLLLDKVEESPSASNLSAAVSILLNNTASEGEVLLADGNGAVVFGSNPANISLYQHTIRFTKTGDSTQFFTFTLMNRLETLSSIFVTTLIGGYHRSAETSYIATGMIKDSNNVYHLVNGLYYGGSGSTWHTVSYENGNTVDVTVQISQWNMTIGTIPIIPRG